MVVVYELGKEKEITFIEKLFGGSAIRSRIAGLEEIFRKCLVHASPSQGRSLGLGRVKGLALSRAQLMSLRKGRDPGWHLLLLTPTDVLPTMCRSLGFFRNLTRWEKQNPFCMNSLKNITLVGSFIEWRSTDFKNEGIKPLK